MPQLNADHERRLSCGIKTINPMALFHTLLSTGTGPHNVVEPAPGRRGDTRGTLLFTHVSLIYFCGKMNQLRHV